LLSWFAISIDKWMPIPYFELMANAIVGAHMSFRTPDISRGVMWPCNQWKGFLVLVLKSPYEMGYDYISKLYIYILII